MFKSFCYSVKSVRTLICQHGFAPSDTISVQMNSTINPSFISILSSGPTNCSKPVYDRPRTIHTLLNLGSKQLAPAVTYPAFSLAIPPTRELPGSVNTLLFVARKRRYSPFVFPYLISPLSHVPVLQARCLRLVCCVESGKEPVSRGYFALAEWDVCTYMPSWCL